MNRLRVPAAQLGLVGLLVLGCAAPAPASIAPSRSPAATPAASVAPSLTAPPTPTAPPATPTPGPSPISTPRDLSFTSSIYPYSIVLPAGSFEPGPVAIVPPPGTWRSAREVWDGTSEISPSRPQQNDSTVDTDGDELFVVGRATEDDLDAFSARLIDDFSRWHGCSRTPTMRTAVIDDEPAVLIASPCGGGIAVAARLFVVHEGFGLVFNVRSFRPVKPDDLMDRLARYVSQVDLSP